MRLFKPSIAMPILGLIIAALTLYAMISWNHSARTADAGSVSNGGDNVTIPPDHCKVRVEVTGLAPNTGSLRVAWYSDPRVFPNSEAAFVETVSVGESETQVVEKIVPYGTYAIAAFQDVDGDSALNRNPVGIPTEPYGFSRNATGMWGAPAFKDAAIRATELELDCTIRLRR